MKKYVSAIILLFLITGVVVAQTTTTYELQDSFSAFEATLTGNASDIYLDGSFVTIQSDATDKIDVTYTPSSAGSYTIRYYMQTFDNGSARNNDLYVNDVKVADVAFSSTTWGTVDQAITMTSGANVISLRKDWGFTKIRYVEILSGSTVLKAFHIHDSDLSYSGSTIIVTHASSPAPEGRIFINYRQGAGSESNPNIKTAYTFTAPQTGNYRLTFDVSLGYSSDGQNRTQNLYINDAFNQGLVFNPANIGETFDATAWFTFNFDDISLTAGSNTIEIRQNWGFMFFGDFRIYLIEEEATISGDAGWRLLSIPKAGATGADISDDGIGAQFTTNTDSATIYTYDNTGAYEAVSSDATTLTDGFGLAVYFFNNTTNGSTALPITLDVSGSEPSSDVSVTLNNASSPGSVGTGGTGETNSYYTLVGNPFASNFDINTMTVSGNAIQNEVQFWNDGSSTYEQGDISASYIISPWQGFWVEVANTENAGDLTFPTSGKTTSTTSGTFFSKTLANRGDIKFTLSSDATLDKAIKIAFRENATLGFDRADASKLVPMVSEYATMAFKSNERLKSVESLPYNLTEEVKLNLEEQLVGVSGEFTFDWSGLESIPSEWELILHDYEQGVNLDMRTNNAYIFYAESDANQKVNPLSMLTRPAATSQKSKSDGTRFGITIAPNATSVNNETDSKVTEFNLAQNYPNPFNPTTTINYSIENSGAVTLSVYNLMGQKVAELVNETKSPGSYNVTWNASQAASGMYYYRLEAGGQTLTRKMTLIK